MKALAAILVSQAHRRWVVAAAWLISVLASLAFFSWFAGQQMLVVLDGASRSALEHTDGVRIKARATFELIGRELTAAPCSPDYLAELRRIAFLPDGIHEFLYAPGGRIRCTAGGQIFAQPIDLGVPDIPAGPGNDALWIDRDLRFLGLDGVTGSIMLEGDIAAVLPPQRLDAGDYPLIEREVVLASNGRTWHRAGSAGVFENVADRGGIGRWSPLHDGRLHALACADDGFVCAAATLDVGAALAENKTRVGFALVGSALIGSWVAWLAQALLRRRWSFDARFARTLGPDTLVLAYQPVVHLRSGVVTGIEVLARWRDVDGTVVYPDRFLETVERLGLTARFTRFVAQRAHAELAAALPVDRRYQVAFNIFPRDLDAALLCELFSVFEPDRHRFQLAVEIVESGAVHQERAAREIETLKAAGIGVLIDDFGTGYSNLGNLAALPMDGIKLDRSFAMAPAGTLMAQLMRHAIDMVHATGRSLVIEGIETAEQLAELSRSAGPCDYAQGYGIARPLPATELASFIAENRRPAEALPRRPRPAVRLSA